MEITKLITDTLIALVWPGTIIFVAIYFRRQIIWLIKKLRKIKFAGVEGNFLGESQPSAQQIVESQAVPIDPKLLKKINDADFNAKRGLYFTFYFNNNHAYALIFAIRCLYHFYEQNDEMGMFAWSEKSYGSYMMLDRENLSMFLKLFKIEAFGKLQQIIENTNFKAAVKSAIKLEDHLIKDSEKY